MTTKLSRLCEAFIEAGWLAAVIVVPLFFNVHSSRVFEPDKISLMRSIALLMAVAWLVKAINDGFGPLRGSGEETGLSLTSRAPRCGSASAARRWCCPPCCWCWSTSSAPPSR